MADPKAIRILLVDDNLDLLDAYQGLLDAYGFSVTTALNGLAAWDTFQSKEFATVFTDIRMPIMDGVGLLKKIRAANKTSPCVLMTSGHSDYPPDLLYHLGANGFLAKPVGGPSIRDALTRSLLRVEDLWSHPVKQPPVQRMVRKYTSFSEMIRSGEVRFGNGGFYVWQANPVSAVLHAIVNFHFTFELPGQIEQIEGAGLVQWVCFADSAERKRGVGIEFKFLADHCREKLCSWIRQQQFASFIPMH